VLRLDLLHPVVSGNKPFKLQPFLSRARAEGRTGVLTFGGPYSNHIHATAFAAAEAGMRSMGIIRGESAATPSPTLRDAEAWGMQLVYMERESYRRQRRLSDTELRARYADWMPIPEGGCSAEGALGAMGILDGVPTHAYDRIVCACGTGTMAAGLRMAADPETKITGIPVLKGHHGLSADILSLIPEKSFTGNLEIIEGYDFGGYARKTERLLEFMGRFHHASSIPTDFVYTAKLMYAIDDLFRNGSIGTNERVLAIHSGGLQGNRSLPKDMLPYS
jgi:1-aminocyclopropane-1-carboxylate deaminase/D-cysteine desulfhydrase-like pyridoxal-dependent ACC family enzyme